MGSQTPIAAGTLEIQETIAAEKLAAADPSAPQTAPTQAELDLARLQTDHHLLLETQISRISELEQQIHTIQAAARENADSFDAQEPPRAVRHRLPAERASMTHKFSIAGHEGYITVGLYPNGCPGEIFIRMAKEGSTVSGLMDSFATAISLALQHGVPLRVLADKFAHTRFEPSGWTGNDQIGYAKSIMDYLFRWMQLRFLSGHQFDLFANLSPSAQNPGLNPGQTAAATTPQRQLSIPVTGPDARVLPNPPAPLTKHTGATNSVIPSAAEGPASAPAQSRGTALTPEPPTMLPEFDQPEYADRTPPKSGIAAEPSATIARDLAARSGLNTPAASTIEDRGVYHTAEAMRGIINMGDAPSCATCGAIMTRNGSCYRCNECGSTSGCS